MNRVFLNQSTLRARQEGWLRLICAISCATTQVGGWAVGRLKDTTIVKLREAKLRADTEHPHVHLLLHACQVDGEKISLCRQEYGSIDEKWAKIYSEFAGKRSVYVEHLRKKEETKQWKIAAAEAYRKGESNLTDVKHGFNGACEDAGIDDFRFHDLRHTAGTRLADAGADAFTIAEILGHATLQMTKRYTHATDERKRQAVEALSGLQKRTVTRLSQSKSGSRLTAAN